MSRYFLEYLPILLKRNPFVVIVSIVGLLMIIIGIYFFLTQPLRSQKSFLGEDSISVGPTRPLEITADIQGAVMHPGLIPS